jgi:hypothetical protein
VDCQEIEAELTGLQSFDPKRKELETKMRLHQENADSLSAKCNKNVARATKGENYDRNSDMIDVSIATDGLGSFGLKYIPHKAFFGLSGAVREHMMKVHTELTMVHNHGIYASVSFPYLETVGGNMSLHAVYRALYLSLKAPERAHIKRVRNIYVCMDNTVSSNKCVTVFQGLACLPALGIAEKVMLVYRLVGHTKNEVDQAGGVISKFLAPKSLFTPERWRSVLENSIHGKQSACYSMKKVDFVYGCPDYEGAFRKYFGDPKIKGITRVQEARFAMSPNDEVVELHVRSHALSRGWLPRYSTYL